MNQIHILWWGYELAYPDHNLCSLHKSEVEKVKSFGLIPIINACQRILRASSSSHSEHTLQSYSSTKPPHSIHTYCQTLSLHPQEQEEQEQQTCYPHILWGMQWATTTPCNDQLPPKGEMTTSKHMHGSIKISHSLLPFSSITIGFISHIEFPKFTWIARASCLQGYLSHFISTTSTTTKKTMNKIKTQ